MHKKSLGLKIFRRRFKMRRSIFLLQFSLEIWIKETYTHKRLHRWEHSRECRLLRRAVKFWVSFIRENHSRLIASTKTRNVIRWLKRRSLNSKYILRAGCLFDHQRSRLYIRFWKCRLALKRDVRRRQTLIARDVRAELCRKMFVFWSLQWAQKRACKHLQNVNRGIVVMEAWSSWKEHVQEWRRSTKRVKFIRFQLHLLAPVVRKKLTQSFANYAGKGTIFIRWRKQTVQNSSLRTKTMTAAFRNQEGRVRNAIAVWLELLGQRRLSVEVLVEIKLQRACCLLTFTLKIWKSCWVSRRSIREMKQKEVNLNERVQKLIIGNYLRSWMLCFHRKREEKANQLRQDKLIEKQVHERFQELRDERKKRLISNRKGWSLQKKHQIISSNRSITSRSFNSAPRKFLYIGGLHDQTVVSDK